MNNTDDKLTDGVDISIIRAIYKAIENNNPEIVEELVNFVNEILLKSFQKKINLYEQFISIPSYYYFKGYISGHFQNLHINASQTLSNLLSYPLSLRIAQSKSFEELKEINTYLYLTFRGYSQLFYQIIKNRDIKSFEKVIDKYRVSLQLHNSDYPSFIPKNERYNDDFFSKYKSEIKEFKKFPDFHRRLKFALLSWLWFLYNNDQIEKKELLNFTNLIFFENISSDDLMEDLIFYNANTFLLFDWNRWDYEERKELQVYHPIQPEDWLTFGFVLFNLKQDRLYDLEFEKIENIPLLNWLPDKLSKIYEEIKKDFKKWKDVLWLNEQHQPNDEIIENNFNKLLDIFYKLKRRYNSFIDNQIIEQDLSVEKVNFFKENIFKTFSRNSSAREAFYNYNNIDFVSELENSDKEKIGSENIIGKIKMMFVEKNHQFIFGFDNWGGEIAREVDNRFIKKVIAAKKIKNFNIIYEGIDSCIEIITNNKFKPNMIMLDSKLLHISKGLDINSNFIPSWHIKDKRDSIFNGGIYKDIPIITSFSPFFKNKVLVCDFTKSFKAKELRRNNFFKDILDIEVNILNEKQKKDFYKDHPEELLDSKNGSKLTEEEISEKIKLSVNIKIIYEIYFEILDNNAFEVFEII